MSPELRDWLQAMLTGLACREVPDTLIGLIEKRIEREYGPNREVQHAAPDVDEAPVTQPPKVAEVASKYPPRRLRDAAQAKSAASTPAGDPLKAKYNPENPEVLRMEG